MISTEQISTSRLANQAARAMREAFDRFQAEFREITLRARQRFAERDWHGMQADSGQRLGVYASAVEDVVARVSEMLGHRVNSRLVWVSIKAVYSGLILDRDGWEIAETFFNSVTRRVFTTIGVDNEIEFVHTDYPSPPTPSKETGFRRFEGQSTADLIYNVLADFPDLCLAEATMRRDAKAVANRIHKRLSAGGKHDAGHAELNAEQNAEMIKSIFYRGEYAFLIGRLTVGPQTIPLVLCLRHTERGAYVDAVLTKEDDVSLLFSYTRSYFHVDVERPFDMVRFIKSIIPRKRSAEIYISLGFTRHGKTELYRNALRHLARTKDKYQLAPGQRGMVMVVFTMPSYPVVFKIIKDHFDYPKDCSRQDVIDQYHLVFAHDRAGRLMDAQEYKYLVLDRHLFADELVEELLRVAGQTVSVENDRVVIKHCYAERRVTPLNVYLQDASEKDARAAVIGYGDAIKDLALTNLFPGRSAA